MSPKWTFVIAALIIVLVLLAALANATSHVMVTYTTRSDTPDHAVFFLAFYATPLTAIAASFVWQTPNLEQLGLLVAIGALATLNQRFSRGLLRRPMQRLYCPSTL